MSLKKTIIETWCEQPLKRNPWGDGTLAWGVYEISRKNSLYNKIDLFIGCVFGVDEEKKAVYFSGKPAPQDNINDVPRIPNIAEPVIPLEEIVNVKVLRVYR